LLLFFIAPIKGIALRAGGVTRVVESLGRARP
jgi:hypothetical protein